MMATRTIKCPPPFDEKEDGLETLGKTRVRYDASPCKALFRALAQYPSLVADRGYRPSWRQFRANRPSLPDKKPPQERRTLPGAAPRAETLGLYT